jgi:hypothetical protein
MGALVWWGLAAVRWIRFRRSLRHALPAPPDLQERARQVAERLGLSACPTIELLPATIPPLLWAVVGTPRLLLPAGLWQRLTEAQQQTLLAHELAHLRRGDHWVRRLELLVLGLYWWNPIAWWARHELQEAEEQCCDAWVVWALPAAAEAYATALLETVAFLSLPRSVLPLGASGIGHTQRLKRRLTMILQGTTRRALTWGALTTLLACGAALLPLRPMWAQAQPAGETAGPRVVAPPPVQSGGAGSAVEAPVAKPRPATHFAGVAGYYSALGAARPEDIEDAKDEVELCKVQLDAKKAEYQETQALLERARRQLARQEKLGAGGAIPVEDLDQTRSEVKVEEARLRAKEAQIREAEVRLRQAVRHLSRLQGGAGAVSDPKKAPPGAGAGVGDAPPDAVYPVPPGSKPDEPPLRAYSWTAPRETEQRLRALEKKLDALLKEVDALKRQTHPKKPAVPGQTIPPEEAPAGPSRAPGN